MKYYKIIGDYHAIQGTSKYARSIETAKAYVAKFQAKYPNSKCSIVEYEVNEDEEEYVTKHLFKFLVLY